MCVASVSDLVFMVPADELRDASRNMLDKMYVAALDNVDISQQRHGLSLTRTILHC